MPEGSVLVELSVSLDGFVAGPNVDVDRPLGDGGDRLQTGCSWEEPPRRLKRSKWSPSRTLVRS